MGNWPSISLVVRSDRPCLENGLVGEQRDRRLLDALGGEDAAQLAQRPGRDVGLDLAAELALQLGPLDRQPVGVGGDHRHLRAAGGDEDAGQDRAHVVARGGAGDQVDARAERRGRDLQARLARPASAASGSPRPGGPAGGSWSCRCGSRRRARPRATRSPPSRRRASERPRPAAGPAAGPSPRSSTSASSVVSSPRSRSVAARVTRPSAAVRRTPERAWVAARVETALETIESLETSSSRLVVSFK